MAGSFVDIHHKHLYPDYRDGYLGVYGEDKMKESYLLHLDLDKNIR